MTATADTGRRSRPRDQEGVGEACDNPWHWAPLSTTVV